ncbi:helix-turn-helix domain-containing protein [Lactococcus formosensis]|uniref:helix-turn-helix domain-containing protein n=1 Tax=Lactococcus formosensis TaxID=1281486 RepID=UPI0039F65121
MTVYDRIKELADNRRKTISEIENDIGFSDNYIYSLKRKKPTSANLEKLADYFNVSVDYLLGRGEGATIVKFSDDLENSIENAENYSGKPLSDTDKQILRGVIEAYLKNRDGNKE